MPAASTIDESPVRAIALREQWRRASQDAGWVFASDWYHEAVDAICDAVVAHGDLDILAPTRRLGFVRAKSGVSLAESLADVDALVNLVGHWHAHDLLRGVSLGWEEGIQPVPTAIVDPLTNLTSLEYLKVRLREVYSQDPAGHVLAVIQVDWPNAGQWDRELMLTLIADSMTDTFQGKPQPSYVGPITVAVPCPRECDPWVLVRETAMLVTASARSTVGGGTVRAWVEGLPQSYEMAVQLLDSLAR